MRKRRAVDRRRLARQGPRLPLSVRSPVPDTSTGRTRVAVLISGAGSNMAALIDAAGQAEAPFEVVLVLSNRPGAGGLAVAEARFVRR